MEILEIMKFDGSLDLWRTNNTYEWTTGEITYELVYDKDGDLVGVGTWGVPVSVLKDIIERPYAYDFPPTLRDYLES